MNFIAKTSIFAGGRVIKAGENVVDSQLPSAEHLDLLIKAGALSQIKDAGLKDEEPKTIEQDEPKSKAKEAPASSKKQNAPKTEAK